MKPDQETKPQFTPADYEWAKGKINEVLFGCTLNARLKHAGICSKYICEMSVSELAEYCALLETLSKIRI